MPLWMVEEHYGKLDTLQQAVGHCGRLRALRGPWTLLATVADWGHYDGLDALQQPGEHCGRQRSLRGHFGPLWVV